MKTIVLILSVYLFADVAALAQPADQSFAPADAAYVASPFSYNGIQYAQVSPFLSAVSRD